MIETTKNTIFAIGTLLLLFSCSNNDDNTKPAILGCNMPNIIDLSENEVQFKSEGDSVTITTGSQNWSLSEIQLEGKPQYNLAKVDVIAPTFIVQDSVFTVERRDRNELYIKMSENKTDENRKLLITLQQGNCFDGIRVEQVKKS
ncbi:hypothetical protein LCGC14_1089650 [marine sediment metagenome]|uniref:Binding domain-containing protein, N-terminal n=2 Tax=root TaxID=1 RepID=A0A831QSH0_9FLAO|nr:hypothetical protein [Pricia sp.]HEA22283.1 hypothetical protein [Pricia antarctica]